MKKFIIFTVLIVINFSAHADHEGSPSDIPAALWYGAGIVSILTLETISAYIVYNNYRKEDSHFLSIYGGGLIGSSIGAVIGFGLIEFTGPHYETPFELIYLPAIAGAFAGNILTHKLCSKCRSRTKRNDFNVTPELGPRKAHINISYRF